MMDDVCNGHPAWVLLFLRQSKSSSVKTQINFKEERNLNQYIELADWKQRFAAFFQTPASPGCIGYLFIHLFF